MMNASATRTDQSVIVVNVYDGTRQQLSSDVKVLLRIRDGQQQARFGNYVQGSSIRVMVPFFDNFGDLYTVLASADGLRDAGFYPVHSTPTADQRVDLMLLPKDPKFRFVSWADLAKNYSPIASFLAVGSNIDSAQTNYDKLRQERPLSLASLLNLTAAMLSIQLPSGTPLDYFKQILWEDSLAQDRFFGFADVAIIDEVRTAVAHGEFAPEPNPALFHKDATSSYKQIQFGEANVQLTFHENTVETIDGVKCIKIEPDIDYYKDLGAHALFEVIPNALTHGLTDPRTVYMLRWIAGRHAGIPEFDPSYVLI